MTRNPQTERGRINQRSQAKIFRRCSCGRVIVGNAAWWSHTRKDGHKYAGRV